MKSEGTVVDARERLLAAAYSLFSRQGIGAVGIDTIIAEAGVAKMSLYRHFDSKEGLVLAFLERRDRHWTLDWLETEVLRRASDPEGRLLAIFDLFHDWFQEPGFEGCAFISVLLESPPEGRIRAAAAECLAHKRAIVRRFASEAGLAQVESFAHTWHMLMKGSIVSAQEGHRHAARDARKAAAVILETWPRKERD